MKVFRAPLTRQTSRGISSRNTLKRIQVPKMETPSEPVKLIKLTPAKVQFLQVADQGFELLVTAFPPFPFLPFCPLCPFLFNLLSCFLFPQSFFVFFFSSFFFSFFPFGVLPFPCFSFTLSSFIFCVSCFLFFVFYQNDAALRKTTRAASRCRKAPANL